MNKFTEEIINYETEPLGSFQDILNEKYDLFPKDRRTKEYVRYKKEYNELVKIYNKRAKQKIYNKIK